MIPLGASLDTLDFDALLAIGRGRLPLLAPEWTDYNYHDPGITLLDLLAWIADTQIYSLGRDRRDERLAMAALFQARSRGARPAEGVLYPDAPPPAAQVIAAGTALLPAGAPAPRVETLRRVTLLPLALEAVVAEGPDGAIDQSDVNRQARASYAPFGAPPAPGAALVLTLAPQGPLPPGPLRLSLGIEIEAGGAALAEAGALGGVGLYHRDAAGRETRLARTLDSSAALQRSGVMIAAVPDGLIAGGAVHRLVLRPEPDAAGMPRLLRIGLNALPVAQQAHFPIDTLRGDGRPGQRITIDPRTLFGVDEPGGDRVWRLADLGGRPAAIVRAEDKVAGELVDWREGDPDEAGPGARVCAVSERADGGEVAIRFGNGVNGARLTPDQVLAVELVLSCGAAGNVMTRLGWTMAGRPGGWHNRQPIGGGRDVPDVPQLLQEARQALRDGRSFTASPQIAAAALALPNSFGVQRAEVEEGWERGRRRPAIAATRTLVVSRKGEATETPAWCRAVARTLAPRVPIGERLLVVPPAWRRLRVRARITARLGLRPEEVADAVRAELAARLTPAGAKAAAWPLGRAVSADTVGGWIRQVEGVAGVLSLVLLDEAGAAVDTIALRRGELPLLAAEPDDVVAEAERRQ